MIGLGRFRRDEDVLVLAEPGSGFGYWRVVGLIWLVYLLDPLSAAWRARDTVAGAVGLVCIVTFAVVYTWHYLLSRLVGPSRSGVRTPSGRVWPGVLRYLALVVLALTATVLVGQAATATWVFLAVSGLWTFSGWPPFVAAGALAVGYEVLASRLPEWHRDNSLSIAIAFAVLAVASAMFGLRRAHDLAEARRENARLAVEEERNRMARDLHDILGHSLTVIRVKSELAARLVDLDPARARLEVEAVEALARDALADVRGAVEGFREISLAAEIARAREALTTAGIEADLPRHVDGVDPALRELYAWAVREGVTNVIRHSGASVCRVHIDHTGLRLSDDGRVALPGPAGRSHGHGLSGLAERARAAGASLTARRTDPQGFELVVAANGTSGGEA